MAKTKKIKIKSRLFAKVLPHLEHIAQCSNKTRRYILTQQKAGFLDIMCQCLNSGVANLRKTDFSTKDWKTLQIDKEKLRFLGDYGACGKKQGKKQRRTRDRIVAQSGRGIGIILGTVLPMLANLILSKIIKK